MDIDNHVDKIRSQGYSIIEGLISPEECDHYVDLLEKYVDKYSKHYANNNSLCSALDFWIRNEDIQKSNLQNIGIVKSIIDIDKVKTL